MTTNIYFDVDGVFNVTNIGTPPWGWDDTVPENFPHRDSTRQWLHSPTLIKHINHLTTLPDTNFYWLTVWHERAQTILCPYTGLAGQNWEVIGKTHSQNHNLPNWWKLHAIQDHTQQTNPDTIVWVYDDLASDIESMQWVRTQPKPILPISPNSYVGLTKAETQHLTQYVTQQTQQTTTP